MSQGLVRSTKDDLSTKLQILKKNRQNVPLETLKSQYGKSYAKLCSDIKCLVRQYFEMVLLEHINVGKDYFEEATPIINKVIEDTDLTRRLSKAAFSHQDIEEIEVILYEFLHELDEKMEPFYEKYSILYFTNDPDVSFGYCRVNDSIKVGGRRFLVSRL